MTGTLVILRHGQSTWNLENRFTGWHDVPLTPKGEQEATAAGRTMAADGLWFDASHTSLQSRAIMTHHLALAAMGQIWLPVLRDWRLNERHYGALQGRDKKETTERYGALQTNLWRRSFDVQPPPVDITSVEHPIHDPRYRHIAPELLPAAECLKDVLDRVVEYWNLAILPQLSEGLNVLVTAHGNSLRALLKHLEDVSDDDIVNINIPTGAPRLYNFDQEQRVVEARYLGDLAAVAAASADVAAQAGSV